MDESQRAYVKAMRQQIATAKEALLKASGEVPQVSRAVEGTLRKLSLSCEEIMLISKTVISVTAWFNCCVVAV